MNFQPAEPNELTPKFTIQELRAGPYTLIECMYAHGQHRIQIWRDHPYSSYPDVVRPNW